MKHWGINRDFDRHNQNFLTANFGSHMTSHMQEIYLIFESGNILCEIEHDSRKYIFNLLRLLANPESLVWNVTHCMPFARISGVKTQRILLFQVWKPRESGLFLNRMYGCIRINNTNIPVNACALLILMNEVYHLFPTNDLKL